MQRTLLAAVAAAALGAVVVGTTGSAQQPAGQTLTFYEKEEGGDFRFVDARPFTKLSRQGEPRKLSAGDGFVFYSPFYSDEARKARAGAFDVSCQATRVRKTFDDSTFLCHGQASITGKGTISLTGTVVGDKSPGIAIDGGTGAYNGARGTLTFQQTRQGEVDTFALLP
jgi:hypothetical protein